MSISKSEFDGVYKLLEKKLGKNLLNLACRHHVYELVLRSIFEIYWPTTLGSKVAIFNRFEQAWPKIDEKNSKTGLDDKVVASIVCHRKDKIVHFISQHLQVYKICHFLSDNYVIRN